MRLSPGAVSDGPISVSAKHFCSEHCNSTLDTGMPKEKTGVKSGQKADQV